MIRFSSSGLFKFLLGIVLVQGATAALVVTAQRSGIPQPWFLFGSLSLALSLLAALWFASVVAQAKRDAVAGLREDFLRERERIRVQAERDKAKVVKASHQQALRNRGRTTARGNLTTGIAVAGVAGTGALLLLAQFFTVGLVTLATAGGVMAGYVYKARQQKGAKGDARTPAAPLLDTGAARRALRYLSRDARSPQQDT